VSFGPDARDLLSADNSGRVMLWNTDSASKSTALFDFGAGVNTAAFALLGA
jgi:hypothetical protein